MEATNEELQSANEELQSSNEEMQSLNEELETSKEELQSTNEELIIVNQELLDKQEQLNISHGLQLEAHKRIEESEKEQKKLASQLKLATDSANVGIGSLNVKTEKLEWNGLMKKMWGYNEHIDNLTLEDWSKSILPEDKALTFQKLEESKNNHSIYDAEYRIKRANDGTIVWMKSTGQYQYDEFGEAIILTGINLDITHQKEIDEKIRQSEELFKSIFDNSLAAIVVTDDQGNYLSANKAASELFGCSVSELLQMNVADLKTTEKNGAIEHFEQYMRKGEETGEFDFTTKNDEYKFVQYQAIRIKADFHLSIMMDITKQKLIDKLLEESKSKAENAKEIAENAVMAKQQFLSNMSHEIRTPMNAILGFTKILLKANFTPKQKEYLNAIKTSSDGLLMLINDILDLAKVDAGKMTFEETPFKIEFSIATMHQVFDLKLKEKNLELIKEYDNKIPEVLLGDAARLHQILLNLLGNAIKFTAKGKITVAVRLLHEDKKKATIEFAITDTGTGIEEDKLESIFENFQQATSSTSSTYGGTGLGLAICKQLVEKQGGSISVKSKVDEGSTFSFTLSFQKTNEENKKESGELEWDKEIKHIKILVVEDVKLNQLLMKIILDDFKFEYDIAENGKIAIEKLQSNTYDIILMDLQMPEMNGFEATKYIRKTMKLKIPIIALTADVTTVDVEKCKAAGMNDYVSKPLDERILHSKIIELLK